MNTNITTDNYEAYLLDYMEGNLSSENEKELKAFIAAQGMDWDELTSPLPYLEAPQVAYEDKEKLKKKAAVIPLYVKIASAAAAAGLLLTVTLWPKQQLRKVESIAELKPIEVGHINTTESWSGLPRQATESMSLTPSNAEHFQHWPMRGEESRLNEASNQKGVVSVRKSTPLLAELSTKNVTDLQTGLPSANYDEPDFDLLYYRVNTNLAIAQIDKFGYDEEESYEQDLSLIGKGLLWLTKGKHDSFASLFGAGVRKAQQNLTEGATDIALAAYQHAEESFEETRERWEEKSAK